MAEEVRLQVPGGLLSTQDLRDLTGWAGAAGAAGFRLGDSQDLVLEGAVRDPGAPGTPLRSSLAGSIQCSAFDPRPLASVPWLSTGVWMDLLAQLPDPGALDVQLVHGPAADQFVRPGHLRFTARRQAHQWDLRVRRPGSGRLLAPVIVTTGDLPGRVSSIRDAWLTGDESPWAGEFGPALGPVRFPANDDPGREGFQDQGGPRVSFGLGPHRGRVDLTCWQELAWLAAETGVSRVWVTPGRVLLFEGIRREDGGRWSAWLARRRLPERRGDLVAAVVAAGWGTDALEARDRVVAHLAAGGHMPPGGRLVVADEGLNRSDGVAPGPGSVLVENGASWLYRSADGTRAGEGTLTQVLAALGEPPPPVSAPSPVPAVDPAPGRWRCSSSLTLFDPRYGDPRAGVAPGVPFADLPEAWVCPVCGGPRSGFVPVP